MRVFIKSILIFLFFFLVLVILIKSSFFAFHKLSNPSNELNKTIGVFGHSHPQMCFNPTRADTILDKDMKFANFCKGGQSMYWSVMTARNAYAKGCRNFIFEISHNTFTTDWKTTDFKRGSIELKKQYAIEKPSEFIHLVNSNLDFNIELWVKNYFDKNVLSGGYWNHSKRPQKIFTSSNKSPKMNKETSIEKERTQNIKELDQRFNADLLIDFILKNKSNCNFLIFTAPVHQKYSRTPYQNQELTKFQNTLKKIKIPYINYENLLIGAHYFRDLEHVNGLGSMVFMDSFSLHLKTYFSD